MANLSKPFIEHPKATALLMAGFLALGLLAYFNLPISSMPDVDFPTIVVDAQLPGASAETMASAVASPLERSFENIAAMTSVTSTSTIGLTEIVLQFQLTRSIDAAAQDVQAAISATGGQLPKDLPNPPTYKKVNPNAFNILSLAATSDTMSLFQLYNYVDDNITPALSQLPGVGVIDYHGGTIPAVRVQVNPRLLAARGLDLEDVRAALSTTTVDTPKGTIDGPEGSLLLQTNDQLFKAAGFNDQIIAWRNGSPIRIGDIGQAVDGAQEEKTAAWAQERRAIVIDIKKQSGAAVDVPTLVDRIKAEIPRLLQGLPPGLKLTSVGDRTQTIRASVNDVQLTLLITVILVALVMFLFLRDVGATLIAGFSIPLSLIGSFTFMYLWGYGLDNISLMGLTIAVGFVVDDAVVVMENITRHLELGKSRVQAAIDGAGEVGFTVFSMTLSLIAVLLPLLLMGGIIGRLFREFSLTLAVALILSAVISISQTAASCSLFLRTQGSRAHGGIYRVTERGFELLLNFYRRGLNWVLGHRRWGVALTIGLFLASVGMFIVVPKGFMPQEDNGWIAVSTEAAPGTPFEQMGQMQLQLVHVVVNDPDVATAYSFVEPRPAPNLGRILINLKTFAQRKSTAEEIIARLRPKLKFVPGMKVYMKAVQDMQLEGSFTKTQFQYVLQDSNVSELLAWAKIYQQKLPALPQLQDIGSDANDAAPALAVVVNRAKAATFGITTQSIDDILYDAFGQRQIATTFSDLEQRKIILEVQPGWHLNAQSLDALYIRSPRTGQAVPLGSFVRVEPTFAPSNINHLGSFPAVTLSFNLAPGASLGAAVDAIHQLETSLRKPAGLRTSFQGAAKAFESSLSSQPLLILAAIVVVYIILGVLYESFAHPLTILSSLPSATFGALAAMLVFHYELSVITLIGLILLIGIVKKNAIMMVDLALSLQRESAYTAEQAIAEASLRRFRPIMMTTMAALLGAIPLALGTGAGSELRRPLGIAMVGGLIVSQIVTLYTVPIIYLYMDRLIQWGGRRQRTRARAFPAEVIASQPEMHALR